MSVIRRRLISTRRSVTDLPAAIDFDGVNDYFSRSSDLIGNSDGKTFTCSFWFYLANPGNNPTSGYEIYNILTPGNDERFSITLFVSATRGFERINVKGSNSSGVNILDIDSANGSFAFNTWNHVVVSADLSNSLSRSIYINDLNSVLQVNRYNNDNIDFTQDSHGVARPFGSATTPFRLSGFYFDKVFRNLSIEANRRLFTLFDSTTGLSPAFKSSLVSLSPLIYLALDDPSTAHINEGTGGNFIQNGVISRSQRGPNQFNASASELSPTQSINYSQSGQTLSYWRRNTNGIMEHAYNTGSVSLNNIDNSLGGVVSEVYLSNSIVPQSKFADDNGMPVYLGETGELPSGVQPVAYFPMLASSPQENRGSGSNGSLVNGPLMGARGPSGFWARSASFNGSNASLTKSSLTGVTDGKAFTFLCAFKANNIHSGVLFGIDTGSSVRFRIRFTSPNGDVDIQGFNSSGVEILRAADTSAVVANTWYFLMASVDLENPANRFCSVSSSLPTSDTFTYTTYTNDNIDFTSNEVSIGGLRSIDFVNGDIGFLCFWDQHIDFSQEAIRLTYIDVFDFPNDLSFNIEQGLIPTPVIYSRFEDNTNLGANTGTGGDFTVSGGVSPGPDVFS